jgi:gas vesicle protein GvpO
MATDEDTNEVEGAQPDGALNGEDSLLKGAAKVATIGAVVGAAFGAARAVTGRQSHDDDAPAQGPESAKDEGTPEPEEGRDSRRGVSGRDEPQDVAEEPDEHEGADEREERGTADEPAAAAPVERQGRNGGTPEEREADDDSDEERAEQASRDGGAAVQIIRRAREQLAEVTGRTPEAVLGLEKRDDGWLVKVEVLEMARIPNSTDVLAAYEAHLDADGELLEYTRKERYHRGRTGGEEGA